MQLILYSTAHCHLCETALALIYEVLAGCDYQLTVTDIVESEALMTRFGEHIPVLRREETDTELYWPFDAQSLQQFAGQYLRSDFG